MMSGISLQFVKPLREKRDPSLNLTGINFLKVFSQLIGCTNTAIKSAFQQLAFVVPYGTWCECWAFPVVYSTKIPFITFYVAVERVKRNTCLESNVVFDIFWKGELNPLRLMYRKV